VVLVFACLGLLVFAGASWANDTCTPSNKGDCRNTAGVIGTAGTVAVITAVVTSLLGNGKKPTAEGCAKAIQFLDAEIDAGLAAVSGVQAEHQTKTAQHAETLERYKAATAGGAYEVQLRGELDKLIADIDRLAENVTKWAEHIDGLWKQRDAAYQKCQDLGASYRPKPDVNRPISVTGAGLPVDKPPDQQSGGEDPLRNCRLSLKALDEQLDTAVAQAQAAYAAFEAKSKELGPLQAELTQLMHTSAGYTGADAAAAAARRTKLEASIARVNTQLAELGTRSNGFRDLAGGVWENRNGVWSRCDGQHPGQFFQRPKPDLKDATFAPPAPGSAPPPVAGPGPGPGSGGPSPGTTSTTTSTTTTGTGDPGTGGGTTTPPGDPGGTGTTPGGTGTPGTTPGGDAGSTGTTPGDPGATTPGDPTEGGTGTKPGDPPGGTGTKPGDPPGGTGTKPGDPPGGTGTKPGDPTGGTPGGQPGGGTTPGGQPGSTPTAGAGTKPGDQPADGGDGKGGDQPAGGGGKGGLAKQVEQKLITPGGATVTVSGGDLIKESSRVINSQVPPKLRDSKEAQDLIKKLGVNGVKTVEDGGTVGVGIDTGIGRFTGIIAVEKGKLVAVVQVPTALTVGTRMLEGVAMMKGDMSYEAMTSEKATAELTKNLNKLNEKIIKQGLEVKAVHATGDGISITTGPK
jgi:hypothetical protein